MDSPSPIPITQTALLLIDLQQGLSQKDSLFFGGSLSNPKLANNVTSLLAHFRALVTQHSRQSTVLADTKGPMIIHVKHESVHQISPLHPSSSGCDIESFARPHPGEPVYTKNVNCAFNGVPHLENILKSGDIRRLVVCGTTTDHCVSTSVRTAADRGVAERCNILLVGDATAAHGKAGIDAETVQAVHLASLNDEFCRVVMTAEILAEMKDWL